MVIRFAAALIAACLVAALPGAAAARELVIIDTDIGDDLDDAFAIALAAKTPQIDLLGITTAWGDTHLRARLAERLLHAAGREDVPVAAGIVTKSLTPFTQQRWAQKQPDHPWPNAIGFLISEINHHPGQITLIEIAPQTNLAALLARDPAAARQLKRIVMMGGSIGRGYNDFGYTPSHHPDAEYNILSDSKAARAVLASGVPITMMPLDSTQVKLDEVRRSLLFANGSELTDALTLLYHQWRQNNSWGQETPTLFDVVPTAYLIDPSLCPATPLRITIDAQGHTKPSQTGSSIQVCLHSNSDGIITLLMSTLLGR